MQVNKVQIKNFRLLSDVEIGFADSATVIVGRNNSGKTSLAELFMKVFSVTSPSFALEDFSLVCHSSFCDAYASFHSGAEEGSVRSALPEISLGVWIDYHAEDADLGPLSDFIVDLDPACTQALIEVRHKVGGGKVPSLFPAEYPDGDEAQVKTKLFEHLRASVASCYETFAEAVDPNDPTNRKKMDLAAVHRLFRVDFINAQRTLDEAKVQDSNVLGRIVQSLFSAASESAKEADRQIVQSLRQAVSNVQGDIQGEFASQLNSLLPALGVFGYPGLPDPSLSTVTALDVESLLKNHTTVRYSGVNGVTLPEGYNGLGARNLIYILLKLLEFFKGFTGGKVSTGIHIIFLEEPEAHLHPQMQEVFIAQLSAIGAVFGKIYVHEHPWPVQFVVSTHSPHMANKAPFEAMRYFLSSPVASADGACATTVKDLRRGTAEIPAGDKQFLHQYMTLTRCDLLFADKAILIEGTSERLLLPVIIDKQDKLKPDGASKLGSQYLSIIEVGGAYAHIFFRLLEFLELRTLVITDLDTVDADGGKACPVSQGAKTSNACLKHWFSEGVTPAELLAKTAEEKTKGKVRIAYQLPEADGKACGRSFEGAFMLANPDRFGLDEEAAAAEEGAWEEAKSLKKSEFALKHALRQLNWLPPRYIVEGLDWLLEDESCAAEPVADAERIGTEGVADE